jgi:hypothetical protein
VGAFVRVAGAWRALFATAVAALLSSCAFVDTIDPRYDSINRSAAKARNESILLNIVRASQNIPLNFIAFSRVSGTTQANVGAAAPTFVIGPTPLPAQIQRDTTINNTTFNTAMQASNSFDITVLESKDFYSALLSPVDLPTLNFFIRQGYPRELLFWLFTDSVRVTTAGKTVEYRNDPAEACGDEVSTRERCFEQMVDIATGSGLTVETHIDRGGGGDKKGGGAGGASTNYARLCFDPILATRSIEIYGDHILDAAPYRGRRQPRCGNWKFNAKEQKGGATDTLTFENVGTPVGTISYEIRTRSTFGIYQFLGRILAENMTDVIKLRAPLPARADRLGDRRILAVSRGGAGGCFVDIGFEGGSYCVPAQGADNTKKIFSLLAQLLALKTQTGDLAITPTVRVTQ